MSNEQETVTLTGGDQTGPTIEESYEALKKEGLVSDDVDGAVDPKDNPEAPEKSEDDKSKKSDDPERPEWLPEDFETPEDLAKAYAELKAKPQDEKSKTDEKSEAPQATPEERAAAEKATEKAGLDLGKVSQEWFDNGGLKDETYEKLAEAGYPREMVDIYIDGLTSRTAHTTEKAYEVAGGKESYDAMIDWAMENLSPEQEKAFDAAVNSNDLHRALMAIKALNADYKAAVDKDASVEPQQMVDAKGGETSGNIYNHQDEFLADLDDPRYKTSEAFRQQVMAKLGRSKITV